MVNRQPRSSLSLSSAFSSVGLLQYSLTTHVIASTGTDVTPTVNTTSSTPVWNDSSWNPSRIATNIVPSS